MLGIILKLSHFAFFFLSLLPFPSPSVILSSCVGFGVRTPRHQPLSPARDAQTAMRCTGSCPAQSTPEKPIGSGGMLQCSSLPLQEAQMPSFPWALSHHQPHTWCLTRSFPMPSRVFSPLFLQQHRDGEAQPALAGWCVFRANTSFNGKEKDLSFYMQRRSIEKKKKQLIIYQNTFLHHQRSNLDPISVRRETSVRQALITI